MTKIAEEYGRLFELWDYNQYVAPLQLALEYKDEEESLRILEKMLEAVSERWDLKHTFLYRDIAEDISEKSEKETEKEIKKELYQETDPPLRPLPKALVREMDFNDRREQALEKLRNYPA